MRLNMWMIKNQLNSLDVECDIADISPQCLRSARLVYAPNCIWITPQGNDSVCTFGEERIILKNCTSQLAFELIQGIFDYYNDWYANTLAQAVNYEWDKIIENLGTLFKMPVVFFDSSNHVIAMSSVSEDVDPEWEYLKEHGHSSVKMMRMGFRNVWGRQAGALLFHTKAPGTDMKSDTLNLRICDNSRVYGYISVIERDRRFNDGDMKLLATLSDVISPAFASYSNSNNCSLSLNCLTNLIVGKPFDDSMLRMEYEYYNIDPTKPHQLFVVRANSFDGSEKAKTFGIIRRALALNSPTLIASVEADDYLVILSNTTPLMSSYIELTLNELAGPEKLAIAKSKVCPDIYQVSAYYDQARYVLTLPPDDGTFWHYFDCHALDYILDTRDPHLLMASRHRLVELLAQMSNVQNEDLLLSLITYIRCERSLTQAAKELYVHKNTLLYRIKKVQSLCECDLDDAYEREYILQSYRITCHITNTLQLHS